MNRVLVILVLFFSSISISQVEKAAESQKDEGNQPATESVAPAMDKREKSELEESDEISRKNKKGYRTYRNEGFKADPGRAEAKESDASIQNYSSSFEFSKRRAAVQRTQRTPSVTQQQEMNEVVGYFEQNAPSSFEYHYFKYVAGNYDIDLVSHLKTAEQLRPNNSDVHVQMAAYHMIKGEVNSASKYVTKLIEESRLNKNLIPYAEDVLRSSPQSGTLITHGFDDTYSVWYAQNIKGIRKDVHLISLDFMQSDQYKSNLVKKGYKIPGGEVIDVNYFTKFCSLNSDKKLAVSMTMPKEYLKSVMSQIYVTGLVFAYKTSSYDNFPINESLWSNALDKGIIKNAKDQKTKELSSNYLPMLLQMRKVYNQQHETKKVQEIDKYIDKIGVQCNKYDKVQGLKQAY